MKALDWSLLSRHRAALMGAAMLVVILFHVALPREHFFYGLVRCGNVGVDMFLFLSGIGLWFSWTRRPSLSHFFCRRYTRVYPAWIIVAATFYTMNYLERGAASYSPDLPNLIANIAVGWSFWRVDDLTFWFIPSIMMMYTFAPFYMMLIRRAPGFRWLPIVFMVWAAMVYYWPPAHGAVGHLEIFWSRIPVFLLGINCGQWVIDGRREDASSFWMTALLFAATLGACLVLEGRWHGRFPMFIERLIYIPLAVTLLHLLCVLFEHSPRWLLHFAAFAGGISLELYLVHIEFVLKKLQPHHWGFWPTALLTIALSLPLAWLLHWLIEKATAGIVAITSKKGGFTDHNAIATKEKNPNENLENLKK